MESLAAPPSSTITDDLPPPTLEPSYYNIISDDEVEKDEEIKYLFPKPSEWFPKLVSFQADLIYNCILTLCHPIIVFFSIASESYHQAEEAKETVESAVNNVPSTVTHAAAVLLKKLSLGVLGAAYVSVVLTMLLILSTVVGVSLVRTWLEEPVVVRERLHFDYTEADPKAVFVFGGSGSLKGLAAGSGADYFKSISGNKHLVKGVPVRHTFTVSLVLLMPESDFNRDIGVFQVTAEILSANGQVIAKSSQPCMLRFRSLPIRLTRTFLMGVPLVLGITGETQKIGMPLLRHKEVTYPRTQAIRISLSPRAGTSYLPQLYEAEILLNSQMPWTKQLVHSWRWTFYVWASLYCYIMILIAVLTCCRPLLSPATVITIAANYVSYRDSAAANDHAQRDERASSEVRTPKSLRVPKDATSLPKDEFDQSEDVSELLRKWQRSRSKRKAIYLDRELPTETVGTSSAPPTTSTSTREDESTLDAAEDDSTLDAAEDVGDSESVCG